MKSVMYDESALTEMKDLYAVKNCNLKEIANKFGGSTSSVRKALADYGVAIRTRGRVKGKAVSARKPKVAPTVTVSHNTLADLVPAVDSADELGSFLNMLRKE